MDNRIEFADINNVKRKESLVDITQRLRVLAANKNTSSLDIFI